MASNCPRGQAKQFHTQRPKIGVRAHLFLWQLRSFRTGLGLRVKISITTVPCCQLCLLTFWVSGALADNAFKAGFTSASQVFRAEPLEPGIDYVPLLWKSNTMYKSIHSISYNTGGANAHESIDAFLMPLEFLPSSDADIACVDVPSSDFDWAAAFRAATTSPSDDATTVLHLRRLRSNTRVFRARHPKRSSRRRQYKIYGSTATVELGDDTLAEVLVFTWNPASRRWHGPGKVEVRDLVEDIEGRLTKNGRRRLSSSVMYDTYRRLAMTVRQGSRRKIQLRFDDALGAWEGPLRERKDPDWPWWVETNAAWGGNEGGRVPLTWHRP